MTMAHVVVAQPKDIPAWLVLAAEVEPLFGPMVNDPSFHRALRNNIERGLHSVYARQMDHPAFVYLVDFCSRRSHHATPSVGWPLHNSIAGAASDKA